ncbi:MAG: hypothetical protein Q8Q14_16180 [Gemmatimonadales bacterium]|nr:hypothetical protein [Gemmatimonadales bacterium]
MDTGLRDMIQGVRDDVRELRGELRGDIQMLGARVLSLEARVARGTGADQARRKLWYAIVGAVLTAGSLAVAVVALAAR